MESTEYTIEVEKLHKRFGKLDAVKGISFQVKRGDIVGFLGPNGAGKSTSMRILTGFARASSGIVRICGLPVASNLHEIKRRIGYMPENNPLPQDLRVNEFLKWRAKLKEIPRKLRRQRIDDALERCDLTRSSNRIIGNLSKGFRQRVGIADAILAQPEVIIMDEPTIGLDPHQVILIRDLIARLKGKMTVLISSHILPEIEMTCDQIIIINGGKIVGQGTPTELREIFIQSTTYEIEVHGKRSDLCHSLEQVTPDLVVTKFEDPDSKGFSKAQIKIQGTRDYGEQLFNCLSLNPKLRVRSLQCLQAPLENVFLAATRRSWESVDTDLNNTSTPESAIAGDPPLNASETTPPSTPTQDEETEISK